MKYICLDLICPYCEKHTCIDGDGVRYVTSKQVCQSCGKTFHATMREPKHRDELNPVDDIFLSYGTSKLGEDENG